MSLKISIELSDQDLEHFRNEMERARSAAGNLSEAEIIQAAEALMREAQGAQLPEFIAERTERLGMLVDMVQDRGWGLEDEDRQRVLLALTYFANPNDVIPDDVPVLGFLDDAIMIELVCRELRHEIEAYRDFCVFRAAEATRRGEQANTMDRSEWAEARRVQLHSRMRRRRRAGFSSGGGPRGSLFTFG